SLGISLDWQGFDGGVRDANRRLALSRWRESIHRLGSLRETIEYEIMVAQREVETSRRALGTVQKEVELAKEALSLIIAQYEVGVVPQIDLLFAQRELEDAEVEVAQVRFQLALAQVEFKVAIGEFPEHVE